MTEVDGVSVRQAGRRAHGDVMKRLHKAKYLAEARLIWKPIYCSVTQVSRPPQHTHKEKAIYFNKSNTRKQTAALRRELQTV